MANLLMAFIGYIVMRYLESIHVLHNESSLYLVLFLIVVYNINFAILNLMPVPPLDGSHIVMNCLPLKWQIHIAQFSMVSLIILIVILNSPIASHIFVPLQQSILRGFESIVNLVL